MGLASNMLLWQVMSDVKVVGIVRLGRNTGNRISQNQDDLKY